MKKKADKVRKFDKRATHEEVRARDFIAWYLHEHWPTFKGEKPSEKMLGHAESLIMMLESADLLIVGPGAIDGG